jgi:S-DNA-T family DNA segregation ATPase FtsK/SpoIIIE
MPNLPERIVTPAVQQAEERNLSIPLGLLDLPSKQAQKPYAYDLEQASHTVIFSSPGFGKSTALQTIVMNLARQNTPSYVQFNLLDFGNNGLLPLKELPHVADMVTLEEDEKLQKMLGVIANTLAKRKAAFKQAGVASLSQYEVKTKTTLPIIITILDAYDGLAPQDSRKDAIDNLLMQVLREGAALGIYHIMSDGRAGAIRATMMSNIQTKMALFMNDGSEVALVMGRDRVMQQSIAGRGQVMINAPTSIQFYLPVSSENDTALIDNLSKVIAQLNGAWYGVRPEKIPMLPEKVTLSDFNDLKETKRWQQDKRVPLGMAYRTTDVVGFVSGRQPYFVFATDDDEQQLIFQKLLLLELGQTTRDVLLIDFNESFEEAIDSVGLTDNVIKISAKEDAETLVAGIVAYLSLVKQKEQGQSMIMVISDLTDFLAKTNIGVDNFILALKNTYKAGLDLIIFSKHDYLAKSFDALPKAMRTLKYIGLIGARVYDSSLIKGMGNSKEPDLDIDEAYFVLRGGVIADKIKLPRVDEEEPNDTR